MGRLNSMKFHIVPGWNEGSVCIIALDGAFCYLLSRSQNLGALNSKDIT